MIAIEETGATVEIAEAMAANAVVFSDARAASSAETARYLSTTRIDLR